MIAIALLAQKGGVGKTTLCLHLAVEASHAGKRVVVLDLDPQGSSARWADRRPSGIPAVDVAVETPTRLAAARQRAEAEGYDLLLMDCPPAVDGAALAAARVADLVLIPCRCSIIDLDSLGTSLDLCALARRAAPLVVLNAAPIRSRVVAEAAETITRIGGSVARAVIRDRVAFRHAMVDGRAAREFEPNGAAAAEIAARYVEACERVNTSTTEAA
jgi:chromosome partitioning protein